MLQTIIMLLSCLLSQPPFHSVYSSCPPICKLHFAKRKGVGGFTAIKTRTYVKKDHTENCYIMVMLLLSILFFNLWVLLSVLILFSQWASEELVCGKQRALEQIVRESSWVEIPSEKCKKKMSMGKWKLLCCLLAVQWSLIHRFFLC